MPFEIRIIETGIREVPRQEWAPLEEVNGKKEYGWTPSAPLPKQEKLEIERLRQTVDSLDIAKVIRAINGLD